MYICTYKDYIYLVSIHLHVRMITVLFDNEDVQQGSSTTSTDITMMTGDTRIQVNFLYMICTGLHYDVTLNLLEYNVLVMYILIAIIHNHFTSQAEDAGKASISAYALWAG